MRAFVIRGFDKKKGIDFERVHQELIAPALAEAGIDGGDTTKIIMQAGSIHKDMFRELVMADVVVADVSVHNANVFYELGIRHAVRPRSTVLIHAKADEIPFDLLSYRYLPYDAADPAAARPQLAQALLDTLASEDVDSPVFELLPEFAPGARSALLSLPRSLTEDIEQASKAGRAGELRLIADEVMGLRFEEAALREVATAERQAGDDSGAQPTGPNCSPGSAATASAAGSRNGGTRATRGGPGSRSSPRKESGRSTSTSRASTRTGTTGIPG